MNGDESALLRRIEDKVDVLAESCAAMPFIREDVSALLKYEEKQDGRITVVERDSLIARGGMYVVAFLMALGASIASVVAAITW